jgi:hypothetical protein
MYVMPLRKRLFLGPCQQTGKRKKKKKNAKKTQKKTRENREKASNDAHQTNPISPRQMIALVA